MAFAPTTFDDVVTPDRRDRTAASAPLRSPRPVGTRIVEFVRENRSWWLAPMIGVAIPSLLVLLLALTS